MPHEFAPHIITHIAKTMYGTDLCAGLRKRLMYLIGPIGIKVGLVRKMTAPLRYIGDELTLFGANSFSIGIEELKIQNKKLKSENNKQQTEIEKIKQQLGLESKK